MSSRLRTKLKTLSVTPEQADALKIELNKPMTAMDLLRIAISFGTNPDADDVIGTLDELDRINEINADLLEALKAAEVSIAAFMNAHGYTSESCAGDVLAEARAAIAKAEGEDDARLY